MQAKAALQAGFRKGNARERPVINRHEKESHEHRVSSGVNSQEVQRYSKFSFSCVITSKLESFYLIVKCSLTEVCSLL